MSISRFLEKPGVLYPVAALSIVLVGFLDQWTGSELSFSIFYLTSLGLVAAKGTRRGALLTSVAAAAVWTVLDIGSRTYSHPVIGYWNGLVRLGFFVIVALALSRLREQASLERKHASTDALTGLANSREYYRALDRELDRARRTGRPLTVAYIDLDNFKSVNDERGHLAGDELLRSSAATLAINLRTIDVAARLGGDEFALLLPETGEEAARALLGRLRAALLSNMETADPPWPVTVSIGAVTAVGLPSSSEELVHFADEAMYLVKKNGKNGVHVRSLQSQPRAVALAEV
jgi:diguanylate cyclase (GGDEF)-like protein